MREQFQDLLLAICPTSVTRQVIRAVWSLVLSPSPLLVEVGMLKGPAKVVGQEGAEEAEEKLGVE